MSKVPEATLHLQQGKDTMKAAGEMRVRWFATSESPWCPAVDPKAARRCFSTPRTHLWICSKSPMSLYHRPEQHLSTMCSQTCIPGNPQACIQMDLINLSTAMHLVLITHVRCVQQGCLLQEGLLCPQSFIAHSTSPLIYCVCLVSLLV